MSIFRLTDVSDASRETRAYWDERVARDWRMPIHGLYGEAGDMEKRIVRMDERNFTELRRMLVPSSRVLECACGYGRYLQYVGQWCGEYVGIDIAENNIREALRQNLGRPGLTFEFQVADMLHFETSRKFDLIFMVAAWSSIEQKSAEVIAHLKTLLEPGGKIAVFEESLYMVVDK
jgi:SAM-dependent methyltransferase